MPRGCAHRGGGGDSSRWEDDQTMGCSDSSRAWEQTLSTRTDWQLQSPICNFAKKKFLNLTTQICDVHMHSFTPIMEMILFAGDLFLLLIHRKARGLWLVQPVALQIKKIFQIKSNLKKQHFEDFFENQVARFEWFPTTLWILWTLCPRPAAGPGPVHWELRGPTDWWHYNIWKVWIWQLMIVFVVWLCEWSDAASAAEGCWPTSNSSREQFSAGLAVIDGLRFSGCLGLLGWRASISDFFSLPLLFFFLSNRVSAFRAAMGFGALHNGTLWFLFEVLLFCLQARVACQVSPGPRLNDHFHFRCNLGQCVQLMCLI